MDLSRPETLVREAHVHRSVYTDPRIFDLEMERIFGRAWIYVAHDSELAEPGDYVVRHVGPHALILTRGKVGVVHAVPNRCSHRGSTLCAFDKGRAPHGHQCPYHGWVFAADGALKSVPNRANYAGVLDRPTMTWSGCGWTVPRLPLRQSERRRAAADRLSGAHGDHHRRSVDRSPTGRVSAGPYVLRHYYRANWKMTFENLNDTIHPGSRTPHPW
jgi:phenylpropionate dioxygenase-like ring-hydroxylating dioxygenase large terminal subunit